MNFDDITQVWQTQKNEDVVINDEASLKREVYKKYRKESRLLTWINFQEGIPGIFVFIYFFKKAIESTSDIRAWTMYIAAFIILGIPLFLLITTLQQKKLEMQFGESTQEEIKRSIFQVNHMIWLIENILWWYILPCFFCAAFYGGGIIYEKGFNSWAYVLIVAGPLIFYGIYRLNLWFGRRKYMPRKQILEKLLTNIDGT